MADRCVVGLEAVRFEESPSYFALKAKVKPRTREKDPVTGAACAFSHG